GRADARRDIPAVVVGARHGNNLLMLRGDERGERVAIVHRHLDVATPPALSRGIFSNSRSCAAAGRYINRPSASHAVGRDGSNPASHNAAGQSWRRSIGTSCRLADGFALCAASVAALYSSTLG